MIVFVHVPKTGGRTLGLLASHYAGCRAWSVDSEAELGWKMKAIPQWASLDLDYIGGHFRLSHAMSLIAGRKSASQPTYVTLLREPIERAFSLCLFVLRVTSALPDLSKAVEGRDFGYFIEYAYENAHWHLRDAQCWLLCGERSAALARDAIGQHLAVVGTTPRWGCFYRAVQASGSLPLPDDASGFLANVAPMARQAADMIHGGKPAEWREAIDPQAGANQPGYLTGLAVARWEARLHAEAGLART